MMGEDHARVVAATQAARAAMMQVLAEPDSDGNMEVDDVEVVATISTLAVTLTQMMGLHPTWIIAAIAEGMLDRDPPEPDAAEVEIRGMVS